MLTADQRTLKDKYRFKIFTQMKGFEVTDKELEGFRDAISTMFSETKIREICTKGYNEAKAAYLIEEQGEEFQEILELIIKDNSDKMPKPEYSFEHQGITIINPMWTPDGRELLGDEIIEFYGRDNIEKILLDFISDSDIY